LGVFILSFTVVVGVAIGIFAAYGTVIGILYTFARQSQQPGRAPAALVRGQARAAHVGGD
jgi:hypothetical protein